MTTKYHARIYFDLGLSAFGGVPLEKYTPLLIASLAVAIKVPPLLFSTMKAEQSAT